MTGNIIIPLFVFLLLAGFCSVLITGILRFIHFFHFRKSFKDIPQVIDYLGEKRSWFFKSENGYTAGINYSKFNEYMQGIFKEPFSLVNVAESFVVLNIMFLLAIIFYVNHGFFKGFFIFLISASVLYFAYNLMFWYSIYDRRYHFDKIRKDIQSKVL